jgi:hypothetical protein
MRLRVRFEDLVGARHETAAVVTAFLGLAGLHTAQDPPKPASPRQRRSTPARKRAYRPA